MTWQPIETAPRDSARSLLLARANEWVGEGYWSDYDNTWREPNNHGTARKVNRMAREGLEVE